MASQLVANKTANLTECYMNMRCKFDRGKFYNRIQRGGFQHRCYAMGQVFITPHAQREQGKVIDRGVHNVCSRKKYLNRTLEIDSPSQTLTVGLLVEFID